jgi:Tn3 transposase DDE domain
VNLYIALPYGIVLYMTRLLSISVRGMQRIAQAFVLDRRIRSDPGEIYPSGRDAIPRYHRAHGGEVIRLAASIKQGTVTASLILRKLAAYPRQNSLALALRELGRIERTLFTLEWLRDPALRRRVNTELNKGEPKARREAVQLETSCVLTAFSVVRIPSNRFPREIQLQSQTRIQ